MPRILIADDNALARRTLRSVLESEPSAENVEICGEADNGEIAVGKTESLRPDVVILDICMPVLNGLAAARIIRDSSPATVILMVSLDHDRQTIDAARSAGARGYVKKEDAAGTLMLALRALLQGYEFFPIASS